jgi:hypothetical protein
MDAEDHARLAFAQTGEIQLILRFFLHSHATLAIENCSHYRLH